MMRLVWPLLVLLAACQDQRPPAPTAAEAGRLNEADAMLDEAAANEQAR